jgi:hypothetical protein
MKNGLPSCKRYVVAVAPFFQKKDLLLNLLHRLVPLSHHQAVASFALDIADVGGFYPADWVVIHRIRKPVEILLFRIVGCHF